MTDADLLLPFAFWALFSVLVAVLADKKGKSAVGFFLLSLFFSPVIGVIAVLLSSPKTSNTSELERLADLKAKGVLTDEEFNKAKAKALA